MYSNTAFSKFTTHSLILILNIQILKCINIKKKLNHTNQIDEIVHKITSNPIYSIKYMVIGYKIIHVNSMCYDVLDLKSCFIVIKYL